MTTELPQTAVDAVDRVIQVLEEAGLETMIVGALATFAWGDPRTTRDIDVAVLREERDLAAIGAVLQDGGLPAEGPFSTMFGPRFIVPFEEGLPVDIFLAQDPAPFARARRLEVAGRQLPFLAPEDLIASKLANASELPEERQTDVEDAAGVLMKAWGRIDVALASELCSQADVGPELEALIETVRDRREDLGLPV